MPSVPVSTAMRIRSSYVIAFFCSSSRYEYATSPVRKRAFCGAGEAAWPARASGTAAAAAAAPALRRNVRRFMPTLYNGVGIHFTFLRTGDCPPRLRGRSPMLHTGDSPQSRSSQKVELIPTPFSEANFDSQPEGTWRLVTAVHQEPRVPHEFLFGNEVLRIHAPGEELRL